MPHKIFATPGERYHVELPFSEVCMHLRVAGQNKRVEFLENNMAQIYDANDRPFSFPITAGEAGFHFDNSVGGWYCIGDYAMNAPERED